MSNQSNETLTPAQTEALTDLALSIDEQLEEIVVTSTNRAFNLGCTVGLLPVAIFVIVVFILTKGSWVAAVITMLLMMIALMGFASLVASIARSNTAKHAYQEEISPRIDSALDELDLPRASFDQVADQALPSGSLLREFISSSPS